MGKFPDHLPPQGKFPDDLVERKLVGDTVFFRKQYHGQASHATLLIKKTKKVKRLGDTRPLYDVCVSSRVCFFFRFWGLVGDIVRCGKNKGRKQREEKRERERSPCVRARVSACARVFF